MSTFKESDELLDAFIKECNEAAAIKPGTTTQELIQEYKELNKLGIKDGHPDYFRVHTRLWAINTILGDAIWYDMIKEEQEKELKKKMKQEQGEEDEEDDDEEEDEEDEDEEEEEECDCEGGCEECYIHDPADYN